MPAENAPWIIDSLDKPNATANKSMRTSNESRHVVSMIVALSALFFIVAILVYFALGNNCYNGNDVACAFQQLLLFAPVLFIVGIFTATVYGLWTYARTLGWFNSYTKNMHVNDERTLQELRIQNNAIRDITLARSMSTANVATLTDSHDNTNTYKQNVKAEDEVPMTEEDNKMNNAALALAHLDQLNKG